MEVVYYGSIKCQATKKIDNKPCTNGAYYKEKDMYLCGMHSNKNKRQILPKDQNIANRKVLTYKNHMICVKEAAKANLSKKISGSVQCCKMQMMKEVLLMDGCLNVFPNNKHQNRTDGFGCASLSPMRLGPVNHRQPNLNICKNIENYHQMNKVWPCEVNENNDPLPISV